MSQLNTAKDVYDQTWYWGCLPHHPNLWTTSKILKFEYKSRLFKFMVLGDGYMEVPRKFTKFLKPPLWRVLVASYFDDLITTDCSYSGCSKNIMKIIKLMPSLGLIVHPSKAILFPCQEIEYLGFIINSTNMTLTLTPVKKQNILVLSNEILSSR